MRKAQKKQAEDFIRLLGQAHLEIKKALEAKKFETARELLEQCQDGAIELGNRIEEQEGEGFVTVSFLEEYCELVYQIHEEIWQKQMMNPGKVYKSLKKQLIQIENSVKNDISMRIEAVFLPYKASMWDSLESVWKAADEDPDCDAYVIPIPYFDRNPDGSFGQMHDERHDYPDNVPVTDYESFDFAAHCPDMIFIHNPYDENNYVTSVHPFFYSSNLKKYTEKLVYIPYFILGDVDLENEEAIKEMAHFVTTPGVVNADKVVVQSENMRQAYVKAMVMVTGEHTRGYWEEKILGLGSPKIDKVMATRKEDVEVPEDWMKVIEKEDGSWKKIIFYNTSVSALLNHNEKMNAKIKDVLQVFKENQEEVALLWRPHPLIEATIKSVRPRLWEEYKEIVDGYRSEGWGIYDDSPDLDRAVALCDAYYGDPSSVVQLCREAGVPVMIQDVEAIQTTRNLNYLISKFVVFNGFAYFVPLNFNALIKYDMQQNKTVWMLPLLQENFYALHLYSDIQIYKNRLILTPLHAKNFAVIDLKTQNITYIPIPNVKNREYVWGNFSKSYLFEHFLYATGYLFPGIVKLDLDTLKCEVRDEWYRNIKNIMIPKEIKNRIVYDTCRKENSVYILINCSDILIKYDMENEKYKEYYLGNNADENYRTISYDGKYFWLTRDGMNFLKWNEGSEVKEKVFLPWEVHSKGETLYRYSNIVNGLLYISSSKEAPVLAINCEELKESHLLYKNEDKKEGFVAHFQNHSNGRIFFSDLKDDITYNIEVKDSNINTISWKKDLRMISQVVRIALNNEPLFENVLQLYEFINAIDNLDLNINNDKIVVGNKIWNYYINF